MVAQDLTISFVKQRLHIIRSALKMQFKHGDDQSSYLIEDQ